jgi:hypothetical protein
LRFLLCACAGLILASGKTLLLGESLNRDLRDKSHVDVTDEQEKSLREALIR